VLLLPPPILGVVEEGVSPVGIIPSGPTIELPGPEAEVLEQRPVAREHFLFLSENDISGGVNTELPNLLLVPHDSTISSTGLSAGLGEDPKSFLAAVDISKIPAENLSGSRVFNALTLQSQINSGSLDVSRVAPENLAKVMSELELVRSELTTGTGNAPRLQVGRWVQRLFLHR